MQTPGLGVYIPGSLVVMARETLWVLTRTRTVEVIDTGRGMGADEVLSDCVLLT